MQDVNATTHGLLTLARGPVIYCVEDVDNAWVQDHFKVSQACVLPRFFTCLSANMGLRL